MGIGDLAQAKDQSSDWLTTLIGILPSLLWPLLALIIFVCIRKQLFAVLTTFARQLAAGARVKYGDLEFGGIRVFPNMGLDGHGERATKANATQSDHDRRDKLYQSTKLLNLVHKIRRSIEPGQKFDIEISVLAHKGRVALREIKTVRYYFGHYFGAQPHGSTYTVSDTSDGFAVVTSAYGEFLCVADVEFQDGRKATLFRYIDFEMADGPVSASIKSENPKSSL